LAEFFNGILDLQEDHQAMSAMPWHSVSRHRFKGDLRMVRDPSSSKAAQNVG
jgi:hypothetical protein